MTHRRQKSSTLLPMISPLGSDSGYVVVTTVLEAIPSGWLWYRFTIGAGRVWLLGSGYMDVLPFLRR